MNKIAQCATNEIANLTGGKNYLILDEQDSCVDDTPYATEYLIRNDLGVPEWIAAEAFNRRKTSLLTAKQVQDSFAIEDSDVVLYGYTFDRNTVEIFFHNGILCRDEQVERDNDNEKENYGWKRTECDVFDIDLITLGIKRYYRSKSNESFVELLESFGTQVSFTD